jgi:hypothetical protein
MFLFYILIILFFLIILIRKILLLKLINQYKEKILIIGLFFNKELKDNYLEYYYNSSLIYIYLYNLKTINKYLFLFNLSKIEEKLNQDILKIINIYINKEYDIDYFIQDLTLTNQNTLLFKELKLKLLFKIFNRHLIKELNFNYIKEDNLIK